MDRLRGPPVLNAGNKQQTDPVGFSDRISHKKGMTMNLKNKKGKRLTSTLMAVLMSVSTTLTPVNTMASEPEISSAAVESTLEETTAETQVQTVSETSVSKTQEQAASETAASEAHEELKKEIAAATSEEADMAPEFERTQRRPAERKTARPQPRRTEEPERVEEEQVTIGSLAMPSLSAAQLASRVKQAGDAPDIVKDDITNVTLFDYSDIIGSDTDATEE